MEEKANLLYRGEALAPMVRGSTIPLRILALKYGADFVYSEELMDRSLSNTIRVVNEQLGCIDYVKDTSTMPKKTLRKLGEQGRTPLLLRIDPKLEKNKLVCQIGSGEPELALAAALHVHQDVAAIDINMGCPKKFSTSGGMGSALLNDPDRACRLIRTLSDNLSQKGLPVSAKIRLLKDTSSTLDFITGLVNAGANAIAIHGRRVGDEDTKPADWDTLEEVVSLAKSKFPRTPILVNGDFYTRDDWTSFQARTKADGVLLARPALYNTSIFRKPTSTSTGPYGYESPLLLNKTTVVQDYIKQSIRYDVHHKNVKYVVCEMLSIRRTPPARVPFLPQNYPGGQTIAKTCQSHSMSAICKVWDIDYAAEMKINKLESASELPGEHKYLDSYFLDRPEPQLDNNSNITSHETPQPDSDTDRPAKRSRVTSNS
jgi:tRNA-dihydrouridine synthase 2